MGQSFPEKLRLTMAALACRTQKELHIQLLRVNPETVFNPQKAYKWIKGVASPREPEIFNDLAAVIDMGQGGGFYASASLHDFVSVICARHPHLREMAAEMLDGELPSFTAQEQFADGTAHAPPGYIAGSFLAISPAWASTRQDQLILGRADIEISDEDCRFTYSEVIRGEASYFRGRLYRTGRLLFCMAISEIAEIPVYFCLHMPASPGLSLSGIFAGAAMHDPGTRPTACRIHFLRAPAGSLEALAKRDCYLDAEPGALAEALEALHLDGDGSAALARDLYAGLAGEGSVTIIDTSHEIMQDIASSMYRLSDR